MNSTYHPWVSVKQAAAILGKSAASVMRYARLGKLTAYRQMRLGVQCDRKLWFKLDAVLEFGHMRRAQVATRGANQVRWETAAHILGITDSALRQLVSHKVLTPRKDRKGQFWFNLRALRELRDMPPEYVPVTEGEVNSRRRKPARRARVTLEALAVAQAQARLRERKASRRLAKRRADEKQLPLFGGEG